MSSRKLYPTSLQQLQWQPKTDNYSFVSKNALIIGAASKSNKDTLMKLNDLNLAIKKAKLDSLSRFPALSWENSQEFMFVDKQDYLIYNIKTKQITKINSFSEDAENTEMEPASHKIAYTLKNNIFINDNGKQTQVTKDSDLGIVNGIAVHRNEWGIEKGIFWSPTGNFLAFYRMDQSMVTDYPITHIEPVKNRVAEVEMIKYPMAGMTSHQVTVGVYSLKTGKTIFVKTGEPKDQFLTSVTWSPDEKFIFIPILNRSQNHLKVNKYDAVTGDFIKTLFEEKNDKWVEPEHGLFFKENNSNEFIWFSKRDGWNHLYKYDVEGNLLSQITKGNFDVTDFLGFDPTGKYISVMTTAVSPIELHAYNVDLKTGTVTKISNGKGIHSVIPNSTFTFFIDAYSNSTLPHQSQIVDAKGKLNQVLYTSENPLKGYTIGETSIFTIKADDGTDLYCRMIKPANFDATKKYPVFYYVYGGPHLQLVQERWLGASDLFMQYMATKGYVVFTLDNRGTPNRGRDFEQSIHRNLGTIEVDDQMKGVEYLKSLSFVDSKRMGIQGWSYGGFMTVSLMLKHSDVFKAAVAGGPVIDWKLYEIMYGERYMDTPDENPEGYKNACLLNYVDSLKGRLLIIHGTVDPTVVMQHSLEFIKESIDKGKLVDYFVYPEHEHNVRGIDRINLYKRIEQYMTDHL